MGVGGTRASSRDGHRARVTRRYGPAALSQRRRGQFCEETTAPALAVSFHPPIHSNKPSLNIRIEPRTGIPGSFGRTSDHVRNCYPRARELASQVYHEETFRAHRPFRAIPLNGLQRHLWVDRLWKPHTLRRSSLIHVNGTQPCRKLSMLIIARTGSWLAWSGGLCGP